MISCKDLSQKLSSSEKLGIAKKLEIKLHLAICTACQNYYKHIEIIQNTFKNLLKSKGKKSKVEKIKNNIFEKINKLKE